MHKRSAPCPLPCSVPLRLWVRLVFVTAGFALVSLPLWLVPATVSRRRSLKCKCDCGTTLLKVLQRCPITSSPGSSAGCRQNHSCLFFWQPPKLHPAVSHLHARRCSVPQCFCAHCSLCAESPSSLCPLANLSVLWNSTLLSPILEILSFTLQTKHSTSSSVPLLTLAHPSIFLLILYSIWGPWDYGLGETWCLAHVGYDSKPGIEFVGNHSVLLELKWGWTEKGNNHKTM